MAEDIEASAKVLGVDSNDVARIGRPRNRRRILLVIPGALTTVLSFIAGALSRDLLTTSSYPYAAATSVPFSAAIAGTFAANRKLTALVLALLGVVSFTLGFLLTGGEEQGVDTLPGIEPMYGVFCA